MAGIPGGTHFNSLLGKISGNHPLDGENGRTRNSCGRPFYIILGFVIAKVIEGSEGESNPAKLITGSHCC